MAAPKGNQYYLLVKEKTGCPPKIDNVDFFINGWNEYVNFCLTEPLYQKVVQKIKISRDEEVIKLVDVPHTRPFTIQGFCNYLHISHDLFSDYIKKEEFSEILTHIKQQCYTQKYEGAACNMYNASIIAKDLGLIDKKEIDVSDKRKTIAELFPTNDELTSE